jgi:hypothetical protein
MRTVGLLVQRGDQILLRDDPRVSRNQKPITSAPVLPRAPRDRMRMITRRPGAVPIRDGAFELTNVPSVDGDRRGVGRLRDGHGERQRRGKPADLTILLEAGTRVLVA